MSRVFIDKQHPEVFRAMSGVTREIRKAAENAGLDRRLIELVNLRVSQINGCAFCLDRHSVEAERAGETTQRIIVLRAWRETELFTEQEQAALALAEVTTTLPAHAEVERAYAAARDVLTDEQLSVVVWAATTMNSFNRISLLSGHPVRQRTQ